MAFLTGESRRVLKSWFTGGGSEQEFWRCFADGLIVAPVVQTLDCAIHRINLYPTDKYLGNQLRYPLERDLSIV